MLPTHVKSIKYLQLNLQDLENMFISKVYLLKKKINLAFQVCSCEIYFKKMYMCNHICVKTKYMCNNNTYRRSHELCKGEGHGRSWRGRGKHRNNEIQYSDQILKNKKNK